MPCKAISPMLDDAASVYGGRLKIVKVNGDENRLIPAKLVVQGATAQSPARIRGVVSLTQLERQLCKSIALTEITSTFAETNVALA
jgi:thioredoxin-like negative regulator of GroEL